MDYFISAIRYLDSGMTFGEVTVYGRSREWLELGGSQCWTTRQRGRQVSAFAGMSW